LEHDNSKIRVVLLKKEVVLMLILKVVIVSFNSGFDRISENTKKRESILKEMIARIKRILSNRIAFRPAILIRDL
jgi:regulatory protein YycH of two-component signal transduction system YycFG